MDWSNERYVRMYVRDTETWLELSWQARSVWMHVLRKVDRAGVLETRRGVRGIALIVAMPTEIVEVALPELLADGCLRPHPIGYVVPNFIAAQEAPQSDRQRSRESRARRRDWNRALGVTERDARDTERVPVDNSRMPVDNFDTNRDSDTNRVADSTERVASVTSGHVTSRAVTSGHSDLTDLTKKEDPPHPARAIPGSTDTAPRQSETPEVVARRACAERLWNAHQRARRDVGAVLDQATQDLPTTDNGRRLLAERIADQVASGTPLEVVESRALAVIKRVREECERDRTIRWLAGSLWESRRYDMALALVGEPVKRINGTAGTRSRGIGVLLDRIAEAEARGAK
jgi:hypothetical protein